MIFEKKSLQVVIRLDPIEEPCYTEPMHNDERENALDCIYKVVLHGKKEKSRASWDYASSCTSDSNKEDEQW